MKLRKKQDYRDLLAISRKFQGADCKSSRSSIDGGQKLALNHGGGGSWRRELKMKGGGAGLFVTSEQKGRRRSARRRAGTGWNTAAGVDGGAGLGPGLLQCCCLASGRGTRRAGRSAS